MVLLFLYYDSLRYCNQKHPATLYSTVLLLTIYLEFGSKHFTGMIMEKESIYITDGIENAGLSLHYIGI